MTGNQSDLLVRMIAYHASVWLSHWRAPTSTNEHKALGDLYDGWGDQLDSLAELCMGKARDREMPENEMQQFGARSDYSLLIDEGLALVASFRSVCTPLEDDDVLNALADLSHLLNKTAYLLEL
jgi:hypothetical protein